MKGILILALFLNTKVFAKKVTLDDAPIEYLIATTIQQKLETGEHISADDKLVKEIFETVDYDVESDEIVFTPSKQTKDLRGKLIGFLMQNDKALKNEIDPLYTSWENEKSSPRSVKIRKVELQTNGYYFFNHIHTNISKDNKSLKLLKISPKKTYDVIKRFLVKRKTRAVGTFTDHDTDIAYEKLKDEFDETFWLLPGIEWGGGTHMNIIDHKKGWELLSHGREFKGEESIIKSRSSEGFRVVNHPNRKKPPFPHTSWLDVNGVEVWNTILESSPLYQWGVRRSNNREALQQWVESIKNGKRHTAISGSDFHFIIPCMRDRTLMYPANFIPANDPAETRQHLFNGRMSFLTQPNAPKLTLLAKFEGQNEWANMGDKITGKGSLEVKLQADFSDTKKLLSSVCYNTIGTFVNLLTFWKKKRWEVRFYDMSGNIVAKKKLNPRKFGPKESFEATFSLPINGTNIVRAELWSVNRKLKQIDLLGATNPIYLN